ncbi:hypothetical protein MBANPS3_007947 [Mucor bainieri]
MQKVATLIIEVINIESDPAIDLKITAFATEAQQGAHYEKDNASFPGLFSASDARLSNPNMTTLEAPSNAEANTQGQVPSQAEWPTLADPSRFIPTPTLAHSFGSTSSIPGAPLSSI